MCCTEVKITLLARGAGGCDMGIINYHADLQVLVATKGHPYARDAFSDLLDSLSGMACTIVEQPASQAFIDPRLAADYDAIVFYDMPGVDFSSQPPALVEPPEQLRINLDGLLASGIGLVFLHHALAAWPLWPEFGELMGGRFFYTPQTCRGEAVLDSGYRHDVAQTFSVLAPHHPVMEGMPAQFSLTDEPYLCEVFEDSVQPLMASDYAFDRENFFSAHHAVTGKLYCNDDWHHAQGSAFAGWTRQQGATRIVYLQPGDTAETFADCHYRRLLGNAIRWMADRT